MSKIIKPDGCSLGYNERRMLKYFCENSHLAFSKYFFKMRTGFKFRESPHHKIICNTLDKVYRGEIKRLIINVPPGYTKTELAVINFIAHGLAINKFSKFIHSSYSDQLALLNSTYVKDIINLQEYQQLWRQELRQDSQSKKAWNNDYDGGMLAVSSGGAVTGFRAGRMIEDEKGFVFTGALIIDDPIKAEDGNSKVQRDKINDRFANTFMSRLANDDVPIIIIMQRVHEEDPTGFLLTGGTGEEWHHLMLPVEIQEEPEAYPKEYTHGIEISYNLKEGPLWEYKHDCTSIEKLKKSPYVYASQYCQKPAPAGGGIFKEDYWQYYEVPPVFEYRLIFGDTAQKTKEIHDFSTFQCWGLAKNGIYLIDLIKGKWEAPELERQFIAFWNKHFGTGAQTFGRLRCAYVEDKSSGTGLIQKISDNNKNGKNKIPIKGIPRSTDKVVRAYDGVAYISGGMVFLPTNAPFLSDYLREFSAFTPSMTHKHDDQIDATLDAISKMLIFKKKVAGAWGTGVV